MRLTTITISGFKSFAKKTVIDVRKDITGIVGPNGSGKSNIAEAIRFVLGEQSMKSMRTSGGSDLVFKGSGNLSSLSRASVTLTLANNEKEKDVNASDRIASFLAYEIIELSREIFTDGGSDYTINGAKVRLKDVEELLALAGIGNNKHVILNQGEADRVLLVSPRERKMMIEDALGLKVFQMRIDESRKKLEKTHIHLNEIKALEREIKPHFLYLERQLEKARKFKEEKERFREFSKIFLQEEATYLQKQKEELRLVGSVSALHLLLETLEKDITVYSQENSNKIDTTTFDVVIQTEKKEIIRLESLLREKEITLEITKRELLRFKKEKESIEKGESLSYSENERFMFRTDMLTHIDAMKDAYHRYDSDLFHDDYDKSKLKLNQFLKSDNRKNEKLEKILEEEKHLEEIVTSITDEKVTLTANLFFLTEKLEKSFIEKEKLRETFIKEERKVYTMKAKVEEMRSTISIQKEKEALYLRDKNYFETILEESIIYLGDEAKGYPYRVLEKREDVYHRYEMQKLLEKSKLRLEEGGVSSSTEIEIEYEKVKERSDYLKKEIEDIIKSEHELIELIEEVKAHMKREYESGVKKVSDSFSLYFKTVFSGGDAKLIQKEYEKNDKDEEATLLEEGLDIEVTLPTKKVRSITAFSGGEKALTSIALLFALAEVIPPPFMVLDETDAPLDESNAKRYGETLALLSKKSKLLVITHNRETMSHCEMLYGVTIGSDGASKLLSVDLK